MTKQEFISSQEAMTRCSNKRAIIWVVAFFGALIGGGALIDQIEKRGSPAWASAVFLIGMLVVVFGSIGLLMWFVKREQRRFGLLCPSCGKPLVGVCSQIAIATGNCGHCGERVFSEGQGK